MHKLNDIFNQANTDEVSINIDGSGYDARLRQGIKITKEENSHHIFNTTIGVFYQEISEEQYQMFYEYGWVIGVHKLALINYKRKLKVVEDKMRNEVNTRKNDKHIKTLKKARLSLLESYRRTSHKLNKLLIT
jgi:hypothetical protein